MKMTKKKILVTAIAVCLIAILSVGTLAWFNANDTITNKFMVADSDGDGTPDFTIDVWEQDPANPVDANGDIIKDQDGVTYEKVAPGDVLEKNPTVENTGEYDQWDRVYVTFDQWSKIEASCANQGITDDLRTWLNINAGLTAPAWTAVQDAVVDQNADTITYVYYLNEKLEPAETAVLFTEISIPGEFEQNDMSFANGEFIVSVKAEALQADNTGDNAIDAFDEYWGR